jgi:hypothetical protein
MHAPDWHRRLVRAAAAQNMVDLDEYPSCTDLHQRCVRVRVCVWPCAPAHVSCIAPAELSRSLAPTMRAHVCVCVCARVCVCVCACVRVCVPQVRQHAR